MTDKITDLERAVVDAAMAAHECGSDYNRRKMWDACRTLSEARAALEPVPGEAYSWGVWCRGGPHIDWKDYIVTNPDGAARFRAALRIAIKVDRDARDG